MVLHALSISKHKRVLATLAAGSAAFSVLSLGACSSILDPTSSESITVYSNSVSDGRGEWLQEKAKEAGFTLSLVDIGGGDVYNRLVAEKANPVADVVFGLNDIYFQRLVGEDVVDEYIPAWADKVGHNSVDSSNRFYPIVREPIMLVCNEEAKVRLGGLPADWPDLWAKPEFDGRYEVPSSMGGATTQVVLAGILSRYLDSNGRLGVNEEGWNAVKEFFAHGSRSVEGTDLFARMKNGDVDCGQMWLAGKATREKQYGIKTEAIRPEVGVPMVRQSVALIKGAKHADKAKEFIDWFGSAELQGAWSKEFYTAPENRDAARQGSVDAIEFTDSFKEQKIDWKLVAEKLDSWVEETQLKYVK